MEEMSWTVVQFLEDGTVEAVPTGWIQGDKCHWPSLPTLKMQNAIRKGETLNTCWPSHSIKIFKNATFDDYIKARSKARIAEDTSDLNTEDEHQKKRKKVQKIFSSSEDESSNENLIGAPPKIKKYVHKTLIKRNGK
ncbi:uncharacterized protein LOC126892471 [Diabrotica virgifera virgifera]|uniref:Uncharacterized protein n=1 Tax=Diabrotica virgifera virgifera TaxID=50390 RepID=A0ABM5L697_DIAVI|nr:uncharacterized protein LOC126892471 [Diabrotica virgifera virgifera]